MAGFEVIKDKNDSSLFVADVSTLTAAVGDLLERIAGATTWAACTSTTDFFTPKAIVMAACTAASTVLCYRIWGHELVKVEANATANAAHNGDRMTLTDSNTVANTGSDVTGQAVSFVQEGISGTTKLVGRILVGNGVDPDAS